LADLPSGFRNIKHIFVLMLENRSFDHLFGYVPGVQTTPLSGKETCPFDPTLTSSAQVEVAPNAQDETYPDPPHEFRDVYFQLTGLLNGNRYPPSALPMNGFAASAREGLQQGESMAKKIRLAVIRGNGSYALQCLDRRSNGRSSGILRTLAAEFAVCENWYSSMPGPTWPNRFFVHAATSGGLDNSPADPRAVGAVTIDKLGFDFMNGTIYDQLGQNDWRVYHDDTFPQVLAIKGMVKRRLTLGGINFKKLEQLADDIKHADFAPKYVFIEPDYALLRRYYAPFSGSRHGNSQHPPGLLSEGEGLIKRVYEWIRNSPLWERSVLIITYDEHGGFYDRYSPPTAIAPKDYPLNRNKAEFPADFDFKLLGVRVPAVIVSPWIKRGTVDSQIHDHTSILKTVETLFGLRPLTERDKAASNVGHLFTESDPRTDTPEHLPDVQEPEAQHRAAEEDEGNEETLTGNEAGVLRIAMMIDHLLNEQGAGPLRRALDPLVASTFPSLAITPIPLLPTRNSAREYVSRVAARLNTSTGQLLEPSEQ